MSSTFLSAYSLAAILGGSCLAIVATALVLAPFLRRTARPPAGELPAPVPGFAEPGRPARCGRCRGGDLAHVPGLALTSTVHPPSAGGPFARREVSRSIVLEALVCSSCGHAEWFAASPREIAPFRGQHLLPAALPYRDG